MTTLNDSTNYGSLVAARSPSTRSTCKLTVTSAVAQFAIIFCSSSSSENDATYDVSIYSNFLWTAYLLNVSTFFPFTEQTDFLFTNSVCSFYRSSATFKLIHHFGFVRSRLICTHFSYHWHKIRNVLHRLTQICKRKYDPCRLKQIYL